MKFNKNIFYLFVFSVILMSCNNIEEKKQDIIIEHKAEAPKLAKPSGVDVVMKNDTIKEDTVNRIILDDFYCGEDTNDLIIDYFLYSEISTKPVFRNGFEDVKSYIQNNIEYPQTAKDDSVAGTVYIAFVIGILGKVEDVMLIRGVRADLDSVCISAISKMPNWTPGKAEGNPVRVQVAIPIKFVLDDKDKTSKFVITPNDDLHFDETNFDLKIYPNPAISYFNIEVSELSGDMEIAIFDMQGKMLLQRKINETTTRIETENFSKGTFIIKVFSKALDINISKKIIINK